MMKTVRHALVALSVAALFGQAAPVYAGCPGCTKVTKTGEGFCCGSGKAFGVELTSKKLSNALAGKTMSAEQAASCPCKTCKTVASKGGACDKCRVTNGKMYGSQVAFALAKGKVLGKKKSSYGHGCQGCKTAMTSAGKCTGCGVGFVAGRKYTLKNYDAAVTAYGTLRKASLVSSKCEACAVAMVTDGACEHCKVEFKNGKVKKNKTS